MNVTSFDEDQICSARHGSGVPKHFVLGLCIGKGANNEVVAARCTHSGVSCVLRRPLKHTDSRNKDDAMREARYTIAASSIGVAPLLLDMWFVRKSTPTQRRGLYMISERYECDMVAVLENNIEFVLGNIGEFRKQLDAHIRTLSSNGIFSYDIKPSNTVFAMKPLQLRLIDLGADCTLSLDDPEPAKLAQCIRGRSEELFAEGDREAATRFAMYTAMLVIYSAHLYEFVRTLDAGLSSAQLWRCNVLAPVLADIQAGMCPRRRSLVWCILEHKDVRQTFEHYFGFDEETAHERVAKRVRFQR